MRKILSVVISISMVLCMGITSFAEEPEMVSNTENELEVRRVEAFETPVPREVDAAELVKAEDLSIDAPAASMLDLETGTQLTDADGIENPARMARSDSGVIQLTGAIENEGQFAYYIVSLTPRQMISVTMACPQNPDLNYDLFLYEVDENGYLGNILNASVTETYMNTYSDGTVKTMDESLAYINNTAETKNYAVIVLATKGGSASDTFKLTLSMDEDGSYDIFEYNNSPYDAFELPELTVDGLRVSKLSLHTANDQDWFLLRNTSSEISLASIEPERLDMQKYQIEVYTADGSKMKLARKSNGLYSIQPGVNYIKVCADETGFTSSGYQLLITGLSNSPSKVEYILNGDEGPTQFITYPQGRYFRFRNKLCPEVYVTSENGFPVPGYKVTLAWESGGWAEHTGNKTRVITQETGNDGIAVLTLAQGMPSPNDLPTSLGSFSCMHDGAITFMDHYDLDAIAIGAYDRTIFADGVYHLMRSDYISS